MPQCIYDATTRGSQSQKFLHYNILSLTSFDLNEASKIFLKVLLISFS